MNRRSFIQGVTALTFFPVSATSVLRVSDKSVKTQIANFDIVLLCDTGEEVYRTSKPFAVSSERIVNLYDVSFLADKYDRVPITTAQVFLEGKLIFQKAIGPIWMWPGDTLLFSEGQINLEYTMI